MKFTEQGRRLLVGLIAVTAIPALVIGHPSFVSATPADPATPVQPSTPTNPQGPTAPMGPPAPAAAPQSAPQPAAPAPLPPNAHLVPVMHAAGSVLGHPYRWGGSSPGGFDCSGLVRWSFAHVGRTLPHSSRAQRSATQPIDRAEALPGDLVFFGSPVHHVGIYMGDGLMIHSPRRGKVVEFAPVDRSWSTPSFGRVT